MDQPIFVTKPAFTFTGITTVTTNQDEMGANGKIPEMWGRYYSQRIFEQVPHLAKPVPTYAVYSNYENGALGRYSFSIGTEVSEPVPGSEGFASLMIPAQRYAIYTTEKGRLSEVVPRAWASIWQWFSQSQEERAFTYDFEWYDERSANPESSVVDIYIAVK